MTSFCLLESWLIRDAGFWILTGRKEGDLGAHVCAVCFFFVGERGWGGSASLWKHLLLGVGVVFDRRKDRGVVCVFSIFNAGGSVHGCMCTHPHTHTAQMGYLDLSPGVGMRHLEGPKNPDGLNLGIHLFLYVYKVHMCMYVLGVRMRSWTNCFFLLTHFFFQKKKAKDVNANHR